MLKNISIKFHQKAFEEHKYNIKSLGWNTRYSQKVRFEAIKQIGIKNGDKVLDIGCGFGDLYFYLKNFNLNIDYTGIDLNPNFIEIAKNNCGNNCNFIVGDINKIKNQKFDWVVASGIFNFDVPKWDKEILTIIKKMFDYCLKGISINFLSAYKSHDSVCGMKYVKPEEILTILCPHISNKFVVKHDYKDNDFTIHFFKI